MATSPTSSCCSSSYSFQFGLSSSASTSAASPVFDALPIMAMRNKIIEKIQENRVTLIVGEPGCGKSSQVPQFLLDENIQPVLCTQPRRFAVVAVAKMVAKARNCEVGREIGYHIGHSRVFSESSKIVFKTAGVLLDEMRERGASALKYKVIILDEVHERSAESDLVLVCVKQFLLRNCGLRLVLMSATADIGRYREYFKDLGRDERVEVLAIPNPIEHIIFQRNVMYLEQVADVLGISSDSLSLKYCSGPSPIMAQAGIKTEVHKLIHDLVLHIHKNEPDIEKSILIFLPTYYSLEQQWCLLKPFGKTFKVHILHRSIETEQALKAMKIWKSHRKVILATNIAESSVTIPKVGYVIDSCRSLQVNWDSDRKAESAELVWVSKSQADQRKGRTGRTCDGHVYRLVMGAFFNQLEDYEPPAIERLSLRKQILLLLCAESKAINDPRVLLQKALDPPHPKVVQDALDLLVQIHAMEKISPRVRYEPSFYGRLLSSFTLSFDASILILKFGEMGMLHEGIILGILMDMQPLPIFRPFGQENLHVEYNSNFYSGDGESPVSLGKKEMLYLANLCAFQFWQRVFKDKYRLEQLKQLVMREGMEDAHRFLQKTEEEWCSSHNLVQSALNQVAVAYDEIIHTLHRFRPRSLVASNNVPSYYEPHEFKHICYINYEQIEDNDEFLMSEEDLDSRVSKCINVPFVPSNHFRATAVAKKLSATVKEMKVQQMERSEDQERYGMVQDLEPTPEVASLCRFFVNGLCNRGSQCLYSHSLHAKRPLCKFFFSLQGCRNGGSCYFSHDWVPSPSSSGNANLCMPEDEDADAETLLRLFPVSSNRCILLLDDTDLHFSSHIALLYDTSSMIVTTSLPNGSTTNPSLDGAKILWGHTHPHQTILSKAAAGKSSVPWNRVKCLLWFPQLNIEYTEVQKNYMKTFFEYLAVRMLGDNLSEVRVIVTMNNTRFAQLQVEKLARDSFFFLVESFPYDEERLGRISDELTTRKPMVVSMPVSYVFRMSPPPDVELDEFKPVLYNLVHNFSLVI